MKILQFELKHQISNMIIWTGVISLVLWLMLYGFYPLYLDGREAMESMIKAYPPDLIKAFGLDLDDIFGYESFSGMVFLYESILGSIAACSIAISVFAHEKQSKCQDFLLSKPVLKNNIFIQKLLACIIIITIINIPYLVIYFIGYIHYTSDSFITNKIFLGGLSLYLMQILFVSVGVFLATFLKRIRSSGGLGTGVGIFAFMLSLLYSLTEKKIFKYISPLYYFNPDTALRTGKYDLDCACIGISLMIIFIVTSYIHFRNSDVPV